MALLLAVLAPAREESLLVVDRAVEAIADALRDTGQLRGTYVIFTSDDGFMEGQHRPGIPAGRVSREPVIDVDVAPTILDMADAPHRGWAIDGRSMLPFAPAA